MPSFCETSSYQLAGYHNRVWLMHFLLHSTITNLSGCIRHSGVFDQSRAGPLSQEDFALVTPLNAQINTAIVWVLLPSGFWQMQLY